MRATRFRVFGGLCLEFALIGCNGSSIDGADTTGGSSGNAVPSGVWTGSDSVSGQTVAAFVNSAGEAYFYRNDGVLFTGTIQMSGDSAAVAVTGYSAFPAVFADGSLSGVGTLKGTVTTASSMTLSLVFTTNGGTAISGDWTFSYDGLASSGSSLQTISGSYTDSSTGVTIEISSLGAITTQTPSNDCELSGTVSTSDTGYDVYQVAYSYEGCTGTYAALNAVQFSGLAVLNTNLSPVQLLMTATGQSTTANYGVYSVLNGT